MDRGFRLDCRFPFVSFLIKDKATQQSARLLAVLKQVHQEEGGHHRPIGTRDFMKAPEKQVEPAFTENSGPRT
jgi:hypothetical protein